MMLSFKAKDKLVSYDHFFDGFVKAKCTDDTGLQILRSYDEDSSFRKVYGANFWLIWSFSLAELFCIGVADKLVYFLCYFKKVK